MLSVSLFSWICKVYKKKRFHKFGFGQDIRFRLKKLDFVFNPLMHGRFYRTIMQVRGGDKLPTKYLQMLDYVANVLVEICYLICWYFLFTSRSVSNYRVSIHHIIPYFVLFILEIMYWTELSPRPVLKDSTLWSPST